MKMLEENIGAPASPNKDFNIKAPSDIKGLRCESSGSNVPSKVVSVTAISTIHEVEEPVEPGKYLYLSCKHYVHSWNTSHCIIRFLSFLARGGYFPRTPAN